MGLRSRPTEHAAPLPCQKVELPVAPEEAYARLAASGTVFRDSWTSTVPCISVQGCRAEPHAAPITRMVPSTTGINGYRGTATEAENKLVRVVTSHTDTDAASTSPFPPAADDKVIVAIGAVWAQPMDLFHP